MELLDSIAAANNGYVSAADAARAGVPSARLTQAVRSGELEKVGRGLYMVPGTWEDSYVAAQHRFPRGIFSHETALCLRGLTDRASDAIIMTFPHGYNTSSARKAGIDTKTVIAALHDLGRSSAITPLGNEVTTYDAERTLCDLFRAQAVPDLQLALPALRRYLSTAGRDPAKVMRYARKLGTESKMRPYLEAML